MILRAEDGSKSQVVSNDDDNRLWQFMQNIRQPWNQDVMTLLCTGRVEVADCTCAVNAALQKP